MPTDGYAFTRGLFAGAIDDERRAAVFDIRRDGGYGTPDSILAVTGGTNSVERVIT
jgi:hypothetical protein